MELIVLVGLMFIAFDQKTQLFARIMEWHCSLEETRSGCGEGGRTAHRRPEEVREVARAKLQ